MKHLLLIASLLIFFAPRSNAIAFVQVTNSTGTGTLTNTAGNLLVVVARVGSLSGATVTDTQLNVWTLGTSQSGAVNEGIWYVLNCKAGSNAVTVTATGFVQMVYAEYSGTITTVSGTPVASGPTTSTTPSVGPMTPASSSNLVIAMFANATSNGISISSVTGGFTPRDQAQGNATLLDKIQVSAAAATCGGTWSGSVNWAGLSMAFGTTTAAVAGQVGAFVVGP